MRHLTRVALHEVYDIEIYLKNMGGSHNFWSIRGLAGEPVFKNLEALDKFWREHGEQVVLVAPPAVDPYTEVDEIYPTYDAMPHPMENEFGEDIRRFR